MINAADIHARVDWPAVLEQLGVPEEFRRGKRGKREVHGPCPACGGKDRYFFDNRRRRGDNYCRSCGAGDGFTLLQRVRGWDFRTARARVIEAAGLDPAPVTRTAPAHYPADTVPIAQPTGRVLRLKRETCALADCPDALDYLTSRALWPMAARTSLRAHAGVDYFEDGQKVGRYPALLAAVRDIQGDLVTIHTTYLNAGRKLTAHEPRKLLSPMHGRQGCAVRLQRITGDVLGIGEGIETCLAAAQLRDIPTWAALNTSLLAKFTPPPTIKCLVIFADRDRAGLDAAARLTERLQGALRIELCTPLAGVKDWNDALQTRGRA